MGAAMLWVFPPLSRTPRSPKVPTPMSRLTSARPDVPRLKRWTVNPESLRVVIHVENVMSKNTTKYSSELVWAYAREDDGTYLSKSVWASSKRLTLEEAVGECKAKIDRLLAFPEPIVVSLDWGIVPINTLQQPDLEYVWRTMSNSEEQVRTIRPASETEKTCVVCGSEFMTRGRNARFCSSTCRNLSLRKSA